MDERIRAGLKEHRGFGAGLGFVLGLLAFFTWRRTSAAAPWCLGGALVCWTLAWLAPSAFGPIYRLWMPPALWLGRVNTSVLLGLFYYLVLTPYALLLRALGARLLDLKMRDHGSYWVPKDPPEGLDAYRRQF